jgi:two-component system response regulator ResD
MQIVRAAINGGVFMEKVEIVIRVIRKVNEDTISETVLISFDEENPPAVARHDLNILMFPGLKILVKEQLVYRNDVLLPLTRLEFRTLVYLARHPGWIIPADRIYEDVWGESSDNQGTAVVNVISQLRRKLTPDTPKDGFIQTVTGLGYKFVST